MYKIFNCFLAFSLYVISSLGAQTVTLTQDRLLDKIKGGWAGQTIGVTFGGPYEFAYQGTFINEYQPLIWYDGYLKKTMTENPGLYDDLYMDLSFVEVIEKYGLDAPVDSFANAFARAGYMLWHANQAGRYNILHGIKAPQSGHWLNNPHADCIDYQIEADYAGLMSPGMPNAASAISDKVGHIMNYGDGWYGGVYLGAIYALAFVHENIPFLVEEALKTIPPQSEFSQCIRDVLHWYRQYPGDWKLTWFEVQRKWADDIGCPEGVFDAFNIDAKVNAAYVVIGLLYGQGDFGKTLDIATRCGQDADCNPASAGGILGTIIGYNNIPDYWKQGLAEAEKLDFKYTTMSLEEVYQISMKHALLNIRRHGGQVTGNQVVIQTQDPLPVRYEKSFPGLYPVAKLPVRREQGDDLRFSFEFSGVGFVLRGETAPWGSQSEAVIHVELFIDGSKKETIALPVSYTTRRYELAWNYTLNKGKHDVQLVIPSPQTAPTLKVWEAIVYDDRPARTGQ